MANCVLVFGNIFPRIHRGEQELNAHAVFVRACIAGPDRSGHISRVGVTALVANREGKFHRSTAHQRMKKPETHVNKVQVSAIPAIAAGDGRSPSLMT